MAWSWLGHGLVMARSWRGHGAVMARQAASGGSGLIRNKLFNGMSLAFQRAGPALPNESSSPRESPSLNRPLAERLIIGFTNCFAAMKLGLSQVSKSYRTSRLPYLTSTIIKF
jgi:hypothetical protein